VSIEPRRRTRRSRFLAPFGLGFVAVMTIGSVGWSPLDGRPVPAERAVAGGFDQTRSLTANRGAATGTVAGGAAEAVPGEPLRPVPDVRVADLATHIVDAPSIAGLVGYQWPLPNGRVTLPFGPTPWGEWIVDGRPVHDGVDLATFCGDRIVAAHDGTVLAAGRHFDDLLGWVGDLTPYYARLDTRKLWSTLPIVVVIDDGNGYRSVYAHFGTVVVKPGAQVHAGDLIGYEGRSGHASGCHLHYGLFSQLEHDAFALDPSVSRRMNLPGAEIARVDPLLVLLRRPKPIPTPTPALGLDTANGVNKTTTP